MFVFKPPHSPLSVVTRIMPTRVHALALQNKWMLYSGLPAPDARRCFESCRRTDGLRMRSCALRIFDAATISIALVILRVFCTLLILPRISLVLGMLSGRKNVGSLRSTCIYVDFLHSAIARRERGLVVLRQILGRLDAIDQLCMFGLDVIAHAFSAARPP